ncbi:hypothetical protein GFL51_01230 [Rhizobium leguminosarum bv. viciae]|nr:hypothetical protein [Rhizobium leguminosarum bv. viciae]
MACARPARRRLRGRWTIDRLALTKGVVVIKVAGADLVVPPFRRLLPTLTVSRSVFTDAARRRRPYLLGHDLPRCSLEAML